jgi:hypothetical protein
VGVLLEGFGENSKSCILANELLILQQLNEKLDGSDLDEWLPCELLFLRRFSYVDCFFLFVFFTFVTLNTTSANVSSQP